MNLAKVYEGVNVGGLASYPDLQVKSNFGRRGKKFMKDACKLAGISPMQKYPSYNPGGIAVLGDVYCNIAHPTKERRLEIILSEGGPFYRTNSLKGGSDYGPNIWIGGFYNRDIRKLKGFTEDSMANIIREFISGSIQ